MHYVITKVNNRNLNDFHKQNISQENEIRLYIQRLLRKKKPDYNNKSIIR